MFNFQVDNTKRQRHPMGVVDTFKHFILTEEESNNLYTSLNLELYNPIDIFDKFPTVHCWILRDFGELQKKVKIIL